jgi:hypothetical protein
MRVAIALIAAGLDASACQVQSSEPQTAVASQPLFAKPDAFYDDPYIVVCWQTPGFDAEKTLVREAVERSWGLNSRLVFAGWEDCAADSPPGIRITVENGMGTDDRYGYPRQVGGLGPDADGNVDLRLTFDFMAASSPFDYCPGAVDSCITRSAIHEFGHALGFAHTRDQPSLTLNCPTQPNWWRDFDADLSGALELGPPDPLSVMGACEENYFAVEELTPNDIFYLQVSYARKAAGALVAFDGRCLDMVPQDGQPAVAQTYECLGGTRFSPSNKASDNQRWFYVPSQGKLVWASTGDVLDVPNNNSTDGTRVQVFGDLGTPGQVWTVAQSVLRGIGGLCADPVDPMQGEHSEIGLVRCDPQTVPARSRFSLDPGGALVHVDTGYCLEAGALIPTNPLDDSPNIGTRRVRLETCTGASNQTWRLGPDGTIQSHAGTMNSCLDVGILGSDLSRFRGADRQNRLQVFACNGAQNQQFSLAGPVVGQDGKCLTVAGGASENGTPVEISTCNAGSASQHWELYW